MVWPEKLEPGFRLPLAHDAYGLEFVEPPHPPPVLHRKGRSRQDSLSTAVALHLADVDKRVLLVSTDAASNLDEMLGITLQNTPVSVPGAPNLAVLNIDPDTAAESYRQRVVAQMAVNSSDAELSTVREQLSGACTTEIASFDEFASLLADADNHYDHIVFDTAPTGHTLRLLSLPKAWSGFLAGNDRGASCLGSHSGLKMQEVRFKAALDALSDPGKTTVVAGDPAGRRRHCRCHRGPGRAGAGCDASQFVGLARLRSWGQGWTLWPTRWPRPARG